MGLWPIMLAHRQETRAAMWRAGAAAEDSLHKGRCNQIRISLRITGARSLSKKGIIIWKRKKQKYTLWYQTGVWGTSANSQFSKHIARYRNADVNMNMCVYTYTYSTVLSTERCWEVKASKQWAHLATRSWLLNTILHSKEPGLLGDTADTKDDTSKLQDELGTSCSARRQWWSQRMMGAEGQRKQHEKTTTDSQAWNRLEHPSK